MVKNTNADSDASAPILRSPPPTPRERRRAKPADSHRKANGVATGQKPRQTATNTALISDGIRPRLRERLIDRIEAAMVSGKLLLDHGSMCLLLSVLFPEDFGDPAKFEIHPPADEFGFVCDNPTCPPGKMSVVTVRNVARNTVIRYRTCLGCKRTCRTRERVEWATPNGSN